MKAVRPKIYLNNLTHKILALVIGYGFWSLLSAHRPQEIECTVPVCFYGNNSTRAIESPETVTLTLIGTRSTLHMINKDILALHIDAASLHNGTNFIPVNPASLFLPARIKLVHYAPAPLCITVTQADTTQGTLSNET